MDQNHEKINAFIKFIDSLLTEGEILQERFSELLLKVDQRYRKSAKNLLAYVALRNIDLQDLQLELSELGLSSLGRSESHVVANLLTVQQQLFLMLGKNIKIKPSLEKSIISIKESKELIKKNTIAIFGELSHSRDVYIMVSLSSDLATDYEKMKHLMKAGMDCARINCAHDTPDTWKLMIDNIKRARQELKVNCKILMDLAGPKLRTGNTKKGPQVLKIGNTKDALGKVIMPGKVLISTSKKSEDITYPFIPVLNDWGVNIEVGDIIKTLDYNNKKREIKVTEVTKKGIIGEVSKTAFFFSGGIMKILKNNKIFENVIGELSPIEQSIVLKAGDLLVLKNEQVDGENAIYDEEGKLVTPAFVSCTLPQVFESVKANERVLLNDGKIEGIIKTASHKEVVIKITHALKRGSNLKSDKGINFPESDLSIKGLMPKDIQDLKFIAQHADIVNMSFVSTPEDIHNLIDEIKKLNADHLGVMLKIETKKGFYNVTTLLLSAMQHYPIGIMIARGDLAPEVGWVRLAEIQEEMLWFCEAGHIPVVWATQVLESLAQKGIPSRAEITDAAMGQRAECVMLNKGDYILPAINMLHEILTSMKFNQYKKSPILRKLSVSEL